MNKQLSQLERARKVVADFKPKDEPGSHYVYTYLGAASLDAIQYELIDGRWFSSRRLWHLDETKADCV